jgi:hypothetical protein
MKKIILSRQGDIAHIMLDKLPEGVKKIKFTGEYAIAYGEKTGHKHVLVKDSTDTKIRLFTNADGALFAEVSNGKAIIWHGKYQQDNRGHESHVLYPGIYYIEQQREFDELGERRVQD